MRARAGTIGPLRFLRARSGKFPGMNRHPRDATTNAAEGLPRRRFTVAELEAMTAAGILDHHERIELIGGDVVVMSPKGLSHETLKSALTVYWGCRLPDHLRFAIATTLRLAVDTYLEPDFVFYPKVSGIRGLTAATARLVVEIADSSLGYDLGRKAALYAGFGIAELWVIDAVQLVTHIHREAAADGYCSVVTLAKDARLVPQVDAGLAVVLEELELS